MAAIGLAVAAVAHVAAQHADLPLLQGAGAGDQRQQGQDRQRQNRLA